MFRCWFSYNLTPYYWILEGPRLGVIVVNLLFLLNIIRVLVTKLRTSNTSETKQARSVPLSRHKPTPPIIHTH